MMCYMAFPRGNDLTYNICNDIPLKNILYLFLWHFLYKMYSVSDYMLVEMVVLVILFLF